MQAQLRIDAMDWLRVRSNDGDAILTSEDLLEFRFRGEPFRLMDAQRGIRKPRQFDSALSIRTVYRPEGYERPYEDTAGSDGLIRYKWRGTDPGHPENIALRRALEEREPLIWFFGVGIAQYKPIFPLYVFDEEPDRHQFLLVTDGVRELVTTGSPIEEHLRKYVVAEVRRRLHQPVFRASVMRAYRSRCAVCALGHAELLDAAHIVPDSEPEGIAAVRNGLSMCKIHHAAFDSSILGIEPSSLKVEIRSDLLTEIDGPMLQYGLKERHGQRLMVLPSKRVEQPDKELLAAAFERFNAAS
ncbi:HNH endonuclease [Williamsia sp. MIQD14]|uniref:HNH endonuclease n=1 Tax=Williamsia sp. MIQD14 TaxID=3425703 RepID=UPI003DA16685